MEKKIPYDTSISQGIEKLVLNMPDDAAEEIVQPPRERRQRRAKSQPSPTDRIEGSIQTLRVAEAATELPVSRDGNGVLANKLSEALELSLDWDLQILRTSLPPDDTDAFASVVRAKGQASQTVKMLAARIDDNELKKRALDRLPELLRLIQEEEKHKLIEHVVG